MGESSMDDCYSCGSELVEKKTTLHQERNGKWYMCEDVPTLVCHQCGEIYYDGTVMEKIEEMLTSDRSIDREISVPVIKYKVA